MQAIAIAASTIPTISAIGHETDTTLADFATRSLGIGYPGGSLLLLGCVLASLVAWYRTLGSVAVDTVVGPRAETFYWITITLSQTLGTALGDWVADGSLGYSGAALVFGGALAVVAALYFRTQVSRVVLFWAAFILTRPLGATVGDFLDKPVAKGGLEFSRPVATTVLAVAIVLLILIIGALRLPLWFDLAGGAKTPAASSAPSSGPTRLGSRPMPARRPLS